jgi:hypothetical protein
MPGKVLLLAFARSVLMLSLIVSPPILHEVDHGGFAVALFLAHADSVAVTTTSAFRSSTLSQSIL